MLYIRGAWLLSLAIVFTLFNRFPLAVVADYVSYCTLGRDAFKSSCCIFCVSSWSV